MDSNESVRHHIQTSKGLFPHRRVTRKSELTAKGLVVTETEEFVAGSSGAPNASIPAMDSTPAPASKRSPIAELLYMRWLEGLKLKWPSIL